jgi:hypothetical protein
MGSGAYPASSPVGIRGCFARVRWLTTHLYLVLRLGMVELTSTPPVFMAWCLIIKPRDNFSRIPYWYFGNI